ncbi:hypothetical protein PDIG_75490 [Penicillium digitatum PHI26]|uniref:Uncharacterized protein n=2 Tax=Penicillium digitatum TaxID=36651 RepID=K9FCD6_PEND2|nr:hypothetical protein PDIP_45960 [Penicillium digitatum Pd1]EKV07035.1 hypothetical protein PDIG_75490 [Penicillium digitatum PHI26]EKV13958.1 hypothetical protein PDIP_45960 [Penicillium digitatum Pd1]
MLKIIHAMPTVGTEVYEFATITAENSSRETEAIGIAS